MIDSFLRVYATVALAAFITVALVMLLSGGSG